MTGSSSTWTDPLAIPAGRVARGVVRPPSSKSLTQRYYDLALLARGETVVERPLRAADCDGFLAGLEAVGCRVERLEAAVRVAPPAGAGEGAVDCGASGTMLRLLTATLCAVPGRWRLDGIARLRQRPLAALLAALEALGGRTACLAAPGFAPLEIVGGALRGGRVRIPAHESSQFVSALLLAGVASRRGVTVEARGLVSRPYVDLTVQALAAFGVAVEARAGDVWHVPPGRPAGGARVVVPADTSAACYPAAAAVLTGGRVRLAGVDRATAQGDVRFFDLLEQMGAHVDWDPAGATVAAGSQLAAVDADLSQMPDQVPTLAALAPFARGTTEVRNVPHLRLKESDRLTALATELARLGVPVRERADGLAIDGCWADGEPPDDSVVVDSHDDHRIAMSAALVGLRRPGVRVAHPSVVGKSYPEFWNHLLELVG
jgi:3-phosphoshikimate 1-carboxyvinyltransferase